MRVNRDEWTAVVRRVSRWPRKDQLALIREFTGETGAAEPASEKPARKPRKVVEAPAQEGGQG